MKSGINLGLTMAESIPLSRMTTRAPSTRLNHDSLASEVGEIGMIPRSHSHAGGDSSVRLGVDTVRETDESSKIDILVDGKRSRDFTIASGRDRGESGAVLILVMIFLIITSVLIGSLASLAINNLNNVSVFKNVSAKLYAAGGATEAAIQTSRYSYPTFLNVTYTATPTGYICPPTTPTLVNTLYIEDWCVATANKGSVNREIVFTACLMPSSTGPTSVLTGPCLINGTTQTNGTSVPTLLTATVDFYDKPANADPAAQYCSSPTNISTCGLGMTIVNWVAK